jgi:predicted transcriptional regulator
MNNKMKIASKNYMKETLEFLMKHNATFSEISKELNINNGYQGKLLKCMIEYNLIFKLNGKYSITSKGIELLQCIVEIRSILS